MWSFAGNKGNKQWVWLALDADTREIVGVTIGTRDEASANKLWEFLLPPRSPMRDRIHGLLGSLWGSSTPANAIKQSVRKQALSSY